MMPKPQIKTVLHTSASERETGEISFETVTAMGTEIAMERISPKFNSINRVLSVI
jgi:hypothetical protein